MTLLLDLPAPIFGNILSSWLEFKNVVKLDSAVCATLPRTSLMSVLAKHTINDADIANERISPLRILDWINLRKVCVSSIYIPCGLDKDGIVEIFLTRTGSVVKKLRVIFDHQWAVGLFLFDKLARHCPNVEEMIFYRCSVKDTAPVAAFLAGCKKLTKLKMNGFKYLDSPLAATIARLGPNLTNLELDCTYMNVELLRSIVAACGGLQTLVFSRNQITDETMESIVKHCPLLQELYINETHGMSRLTDRGVSAIAGLQHLHTLDLNTSQKVTDSGIIELITRNTRLAKLYIADNNNISDKALFAIAKLGANITHLEAHFCDTRMTDKGVLLVAEKCPKLQQITVSHTGKVTKKAVKKLGKLAELVVDEFW